MTWRWVHEGGSVGEDDTLFFGLSDGEGCYLGGIESVKDKAGSGWVTHLDDDPVTGFKTAWGAASALLRECGLICNEPPGLPQDVLKAIDEVNQMAKGTRI